MKGERTAEDVIRELIKQADGKSIMWGLRSDIRGRDDPKLLDENARNVGKLVQSLSEEDRELLQNLTSEDWEAFAWVGNGYTRARPKEPITRTRGPVSLRGTRVQKSDG